MTRILIGPSGWSYPHWRGRLYPEDVPSGKWLPYYTQHLDSVEINATFYRLQRSETVAGWAAVAPATFRFAFKASRYLTHTRRLLDVGEGLGRLLATTTPLGDKRGPMLVQLPPEFPADPQRLATFLDACPAEYLVAVEFRDTTWYIPETEAVLRRHGAALVWSDYPGAESPDWDTAAFLYVRRHGAGARYGARYGRRALQVPADRLAAAGKDTYCYFNNDAEAATPHDALELAAIVDSQT